MVDPVELDAGPRINLKTVKALCVDSNAQGLDIVGQTLRGFGMEKIKRAGSSDEAKTILTKESIDLLLCDALLRDGSGYDLIRWLRASKLEPNRFIPVIVVTGHTGASFVEGARDCGANFVVSKPLTPAVLMQRILWVARGGRAFVEAEGYTGPDRRYKFEGIPDSGKGRRKEDVTGALASPQNQT